MALWKAAVVMLTRPTEGVKTRLPQHNRG